MRTYLASLFRDEYTIYEAKSGEEGLKLAEQYSPDIIISDIKMEGGNGIDFCRAIKESPATSHIPLILLTGSTSSETKLSGIEVGADDYITKPFDSNILSARVAALLKNRSIMQQYFYNEITFNKNDIRVSPENKAFLQKCISIVDSHLEDDHFNAQSFISEMSMSRSSLLRKIKSLSGLSINEFIRFIRLRKAAELFINTDANVNEVAFQVGISDIKYFRSQFNKVFGMNPSDYIKRFRKTLGYKHRINKDITSGNQTEGPL
jgi:YesN/AraC family two-component response regulator